MKHRISCGYCDKEITAGGFLVGPWLHLCSRCYRKAMRKRVDAERLSAEGENDATQSC